MNNAVRRAVFGRCKSLGIDDTTRRGLVLELFDHAVNPETGEGTITALSEAEGRLFLRYLMQVRSAGGRRLVFPDARKWLAGYADWIQSAGMRTRLYEEPQGNPRATHAQREPIQQKEMKPEPEALVQPGFSGWDELLRSLPPDVPGGGLASMVSRRSALEAARRMGLTPERAEGLLRKTAGQQGGGSSWRFQVTVGQLRAFNKMLRSMKLERVQGAW